MNSSNGMAAIIYLLPWVFVAFVGWASKEDTDG
jgi:hypothetical protein